MDIFLCSLDNYFGRQDLTKNVARGTVTLLKTREIYGVIKDCTFNL